MTEPDEMDEDGRWFADDDDGLRSIGCCECESGWTHGCMDDMCRSCMSADECKDGYPCRHCNPGGEVLR